MKRRVNRPQESVALSHGATGVYQRNDRSNPTIKYLATHGLKVAAITIVAVLLVAFKNPTSTRRSRLHIGPPSGFVVRPTKKERYTRVPETCKRTFHIPASADFRLPVIRALRSLGWRMATNEQTAHLIWDKFVQRKRYSALHPWQRYNHIPGFESWDRKDLFAKGFQDYRKRHPEKSLYFLPETYILGTEEGQLAFEERLKNGGLKQPWVLKIPSVNNGRGIEMLGGDSRGLHNVVERVRSEIEALAKNKTLDQYETIGESARLPQSPEEEKSLRGGKSKWIKKKYSSYVIQAFICNELTWTGNRKFDFRMWWMVPSIDPLIVLYADGYARIGNSVYDETDFSDTSKQLTAMTNLAGELKGTMDEVKEVIYQHYHRNYGVLSKRFKGDPVQHVRNQMMEAIAETVAAFKEKTFGNDEGARFSPENGISLYGADFVLDNNLDVWYLESQAGPGLIEDYDFRVAMHRQYLRTMFTVMEEIQDKIEANPKAIVLPLNADIEGWDIIYAGDWMYQYKEYERGPPVQTCSIT